MVKRFLVSLLTSIVAITGFIAIVAPNTVTAASCPTGGNFLTFPAWNRGLECDQYGAVNVKNEGIPRVVWTIALNVVEILLQVAGLLAVVMILVSAFKYLTNGGDEQKIAAAKTSLLQAIVGLAIALISVTAINFIVASLWK
jgi:hypothetical protein